ERRTQWVGAVKVAQPPEPLGPFVSVQQKPAAVTLIPATGKTSAVLPAISAPRRSKPRSLHLGILLWLVGLVIVGSVLYVATPIGQRFIAGSFAPHGAEVGLGEDTLLSVPWATSAGLVNLEIGGAAGPRVQAPGTGGPPL